MKITNIAPDKHKFTYNEFLKEAKANGWIILPIINSYRCPPQGKFLFLEHRIFEDEKSTKCMARVEMKNDVFSTYFFHTLSEDFINQGLLYVNYIKQLGHEIGLCFDMLSIAASFNTQIHDHIIGILLPLLNYNINVKGVAFCGDMQLAKETNFVGEQYFFNFCDQEGLLHIKNNLGEKKVICWGVHPLEEYGLLYSSPSTVSRKHTLDDISGEIRINSQPYTRKEAKEAVFNFLRNANDRTLVSFTPKSWKMED